MRSAFVYLIIFAVAFPGGAFGQTAFPPTLMLTWQANTFVPSDYQGKTLPTNGSPIKLTLELFDRGKTVNTSQYEIRWFANNTLFASGKGLNQTKFTPRVLSVNSYRIRAVVIGYNGNLDLESSTVIPVVQPTAVIDAPYKNNIISGASAPVRARAYFFNTTKASDLKLEWRTGSTLAGQGTLDENTNLTVDLSGASSGSLLSLALRIINALVPNEQNSVTVNLTAQ